jgi:hypothetical protein
MQSTTDVRRSHDKDLDVHRPPSTRQLASIDKDLDTAPSSIDPSDRALLHRLLRLARLLEAEEDAGTFLGPSAISQTRQRGSASANPTHSSDPSRHPPEHAFQSPGGACSPGRTEFEYDDDDDIYDNSSNEMEPQNAQNLQTPPTSSIDPSVHHYLPGDTSRGAWSGRDRRGSEARSTEHNNTPGGRDPTQSLPARARPHAIVEQRYRHSMNEKLRLLHDAIPASGEFSTEASNGQQVDPAHILAQTTCKSKSAVLANAVSYIEVLLETHRRLDYDSQEIQDQVQQWLTEFNEDDNDHAIRDPASMSGSSQVLQ